MTIASAAAETQTMNPRPLTPEQFNAHIHRIVREALRLDLAASVKRIDHGVYLVPSTTQGDVVYTVTGKEPPLDCTCEAHWHMPLCKHRAAVLIRRWQAEGSVIAVEEEGEQKGNVVVVTKRNVSGLAYPMHRWPALVNGAPPPSVPDADLTLDLGEEET